MSIEQGKRESFTLKVSSPITRAEFESAGRTWLAIQDGTHVWHHPDATPLDRRILEFLCGKSKASIHEFVKQCWSELYNTEHRTRYDVAITRLNAKLLRANPKSKTFSIRGMTIVLD